MAARTKVNFVWGTVGTALPGSGTTGTLSSAGLVTLPTIAAPDVVALVVDPNAAVGGPEIVWVTAHTAGASTATIARGKEGTTIRAHGTTEEWRHVPTSQDWKNVEDKVPFFNVINYGAVDGGSAAINKQAFQDCHDALSGTTKGGTFFVPCGFFDVGDWQGWRLPSDGVKTITYKGEGQGSIVRNSVNLTAGTRFIEASTSTPANINFFSKIEDMWIQGPGGIIVYGTSPATSDGVAVYTRFQMRNVRMSGFRSAAVLRGDHFQLITCEFFNNYYGNYCAQNLTGLDYDFDNCLYRANTMAGIGIKGGTVPDGTQGFLGGANFKKGWFGSQPYAFYGEGNATTLVMMVNVTFFQTSFENHSNGIIYCAGQKGSIQNVMFVQSRTFSIGTQAQLPATSGMADMFYADRIGPLSFTDCVMLVPGLTNYPTNSVINVNFITEGSLVWNNWYSVFLNAKAQGVAFICCLTSPAAGVFLQNGAGIARARAYPPSGTVQDGDLVTLIPGGAVARPTALSLIEGVAMNTPTHTNELVIVGTNADAINVNTNSTLTNFTHVVVQDTTDFYKCNNIAPSAATSTNRIIGKCTQTAVPAGNMPVRLRL